MLLCQLLASFQELRTKGGAIGSTTRFLHKPLVQMNNGGKKKNNGE